MKRLYFLILLICLTVSSQEKNLAQKLGFEANSKLLIIHADDIGVAHSVNMASFDGFSSESVTSGSVMVPCPWFLEAAEYAKSNPNHDLGLHLTITSEWENYKWSGISSSNQIKSLINEQGHFYSLNEGVRLNAKYEDVKRELTSQINYSKANGLIPTHLDSHMGAVRATPEIFQAYFEVGHENRIPISLPIESKLLIENGSIDTSKFDTSKLLWAKYYTKKHDSSIDYKSWKKFYMELLDIINPGFNILFVHLGYNNDELKAMMIDHPDWGSKWRELDLKILQDKEFKNLIKERNIKLITWRQVKDILY